jgi:hypothetical protein
MTKFTATIRHHSIARARQIEVTGTLTKAKQAAAREFGGEQRDYEIAIFEDWHGQPELVASRKVGASKWQDATR